VEFELDPAIESGSQKGFLASPVAYSTIASPSPPITSVAQTASVAKGAEKLGFGPDYAFSSRLSSFKKRQSVPSARSPLGLDVIMPTSWRRSA
jgi:hypothetical protein